MKCTDPRHRSEPQIPWRIIVILMIVLAFVATALLTGRHLDVIVGLLGAVFGTANWLESHLPRPRL